MIEIQRVYGRQQRSQGFRILVDRLWPRGIKKEELKADLWLKDVAPSNDLRKWFNHDPARWDEFKRRYFRELESRQSAIDSIVEKTKDGDIILLYGARDDKHNNAAALKEYLESRPRRT